MIVINFETGEIVCVMRERDMILKWKEIKQGEDIVAFSYENFLWKVLLKLIRELNV